MTFAALDSYARCTIEKRRLILVRHGNRQDRVESGDWEAYSQLHNLPLHDPPLSFEGHAQALAVAAQLEDCSAVELLTSPYLRCLGTAVPLSQRLGLKMQIEPALGEWSHPRKNEYRGPAQCMVAPDLSPYAPHFVACRAVQWAPVQIVPNESVLDLHLRAHRLATELEKVANGTTVCISHASVILALARALVRDATLQLEVGMASITVLQRDAEGNWTLVSQTEVAQDSSPSYTFPSDYQFELGSIDYTKLRREEVKSDAGPRAEQ